MPFARFFSILVFAASFCAAQSVHSARVQTERPDLRKFFSEYDAKGTFVLYALNTDSCIRYNPERARTRFIPASTFKIFNTMAALEAGSIPDDSTILKWDGIQRFIPAWNRDQDMRSAFRNSTVWFYQELARRTGEERLKKMMEREQYGNSDVSGGVDRFWLNGGLRISADEQIDFLTKLYRRTLHFPKRTQDVVFRIMILEENPNYTLRGKTGWSEQDGNQIGWFVGFVTRKSETFVYALNLESSNPDFPMSEARKTILRGILEELRVAE